MEESANPTSPIGNANVTRKRKATTSNVHSEYTKRHTRCEPVHPTPGLEDRSSSDTCKQCERDRVSCTRTRSRIRFSNVSARVAAGNGDGFSATETPKTKVPSELLVYLSWRGEVKEKLILAENLVYVDETAELEACYGPDEESRDSSDLFPTPARSHPQLEINTANFQIHAPVANAPEALGSHENPSLDSFVMRGLVKPPSGDPLSRTQNTLEFLLLRYYIDHLSIWLDFCDPDRHFQMVVPQRARNCPPLMNAILAAAARHLTRVPKNRTPSGAVQYDGRILQDLTDETALHYHNKCIHDLLKLGGTPEQTRNEDLLAAAIILRFYEEVDYPLQDEKIDNELFLRVINMFVDAQIPNGPSPTTLPNELYTSPASVSINNMNSVESKRWYMADLRQAAFWVAFRQEVYSAFLKQRPFNMSLSRCDVFRSFSPAEDALWTARLVIFCADVLEFCYGSTSSQNRSPQDPTTSSTPPKERWTHLKTLSTKWVDLLPSSFEPIYFRKPNRTKGEVFPEICYLTNLHVAGVQHVELARILLAVYDPNIPKLGFGHRARMRALSQELRASVLRLCGIAIHNRKNPPSLTTALLGIVVCGEQFEDAGEQIALLGLLDELEYDLGWPVGNYRDRLKESWGA
ncbi:hypothetical protein BJX99DRAFT_269922 [Aspergillus californicus]